MWALTVWALLASIGVIWLGATLWWRIELREREAVEVDAWGPGLTAG